MDGRFRKIYTISFLYSGLVFPGVLVTFQTDIVHYSFCFNFNFMQPIFFIEKKLLNASESLVKIDLGITYYYLHNIIELLYYIEFYYIELLSKTNGQTE